MTIQANEQKFKELILYISAKCASDRRFGAVKLNKILYLSDFTAYGEYGSPITGVEYQKLPEGPAPRRLLPLRRELVDSRELAVQEIPLLGGKVMHKTVNLRRPNLSLFSGQEVAIVDAVIELFADDDAQAVTDRTHRMAGWNAVEMRETIPYSTILVSCEPLTAGEIDRGQELAAEVSVNA